MLVAGNEAVMQARMRRLPGAECFARDSGTRPACPRSRHEAGTRRSGQRFTRWRLDADPDPPPVASGRLDRIRTAVDADAVGARASIRFQHTCNLGDRQRIGREFIGRECLVTDAPRESSAAATAAIMTRAVRLAAPSPGTRRPDPPPRTRRTPTVPHCGALWNAAAGECRGDGHASGVRPALRSRRRSRAAST